MTHDSEETAGLTRRDVLARIGLGTTAASLGLLYGCAPSLRNSVLPNPTLDADRKTMVVLGSGITGLAAGAMLTRLGHRVTVLEANPTLLGGHCRCFEVDEFRFCSGPQYVWSFEPGTVGARVLEFLDLQHDVIFESMDPDGFERIVLGPGEYFDIPMGLDRFQARLTETFPEEETGISAFFSLLNDVFRSVQLIFDRALYIDNGAAMERAVLGQGAIPLDAKLRLVEVKRWTLAELCDHCGLSSRVRRILYGHGGIFAENIDRLSVVLYAAATGYYHAGSRFPRDGFEALLEGFAGVIEGGGGQLLLGKRIEGLDAEDGRLVAARCTDGSSYEGDLFFSTLSPRLTAGLVPGADPDVFRYTPSNTLLAAFVGTDHPGVADLMARRNVWWQADDGLVDYEAPDMMQPPRMLFVGAPSANRAAVGNPSGREHGLVLFAPGSWAQAREAADRSTEDHDALRTRIGELLVDALDSHVLPGIKDRVQTLIVHTPLDIQNEVASEEGSVYGRALDPASLLRGVRDLQPAAQNLVIGCASIGIPGVATAIQTAVRRVEELTGVAV